MSRVRGALLGALAGAVRVCRRWPGWIVGGAGVVLCVLGWYGVSGEQYEARQLPYLASATAPGAALIVAGAVLLAGRTGGGPDEETRRRIAELHTLLTEPVGEPSGLSAAAVVRTSAAGGELPLALPQGGVYHRADCPLIAGKPEAAPVDPAGVRERGLRPCPVCDPEQQVSERAAAEP